MSAPETQPLVSKRSIISGVIVGLLHAGLAVSLWNYWFDSLWEMLAVKPLNGLYLTFGMFFLGFVPAVSYVGRKVVSPAIIVTGLLLLSGVGSWIGGSIQAPRSGPTPFGLYMLLWVLIVALAGITGRWEFRRKQRASS